MSNWVNVGKAVKSLNHLKDELGPRKFGNGIARALNKTLNEGRTVARDAVKAEFNIPQKNLNGINVRRANSQNLTGHIYASSRPLPADTFAPRFKTQSASITVSKKGKQKVTERKSKRSVPIGVSIEVHKGQRQVIPFAFMIAGGKPRVFGRGAYNGSKGFEQRHKRVNSKGSDIPIKPLLSVSVHMAVMKQESIDKISDKLEREIFKNMGNELMEACRKARLKAANTSR